MGSISKAKAQSALSSLSNIQSSWSEILPGDSVRDAACRLLDLYPLRAADSLQLAAALVWCRQRAAGRIFLSSDKRLSDAAKAEGFSVIEI